MTKSISLQIWYPQQCDIVWYGELIPLYHYVSNKSRCCHNIITWCMEACLVCGFYSKYHHIEILDHNIMISPKLMYLNNSKMDISSIVLIYKYGCSPNGPLPASMNTHVDLLMAKYTKFDRCYDWPIHATPTMCPIVA